MVGTKGHTKTRRGEAYCVLECIVDVWSGLKRMAPTRGRDDSPAGTAHARRMAGGRLPSEEGEGGGL